jgi:hypothetical protein
MTRLCQIKYEVTAVTNQVQSRERAPPPRRHARADPHHLGATIHRTPCYGDPATPVASWVRSSATEPATTRSRPDQMPASNYELFETVVRAKDRRDTATSPS